MRGITPLKQNTSESLPVRGGSSTLTPKQLYEKRLKEGNVKVQRVNIFGKNVYTRKNQ